MSKEVVVVIGAGALYFLAHVALRLRIGGEPGGSGGRVRRPDRVRGPSSSRRSSVDPFRPLSAPPESTGHANGATCCRVTRRRIASMTNENAVVTAASMTSV